MRGVERGRPIESNAAEGRGGAHDVIDASVLGQDKLRYPGGGRRINEGPGKFVAEPRAFCVLAR
jgi:hypothetical protein